VRRAAAVVEERNDRLEIPLLERIETGARPSGIWFPWIAGRGLLPQDGIARPSDPEHAE
jgi:hypothetical protein